ncbi:methyltransferase domain-containing protein [Halarcobacter ebronensis]|uniref:Methyltransferase type 11 n=1 Tax=Halarcobacter ebronensis TaxID=1462615 RepID=A0A4Q1ARN0_9BACT|nr:methyltransferase domain-containing protein [Halarcobacter ebronensis]QKF83305.1 SAM-dependent methyltransferase [Halarcobacter ebronensis]RXK05867.1 methyltransferase type 11 [Halarcobacter ebronensis]
MLSKLVDIFVCPSCKNSLSIDVEEEKNNRIKEGTFHCSSCSSSYKIINFVPRFVTNEEYVSSFGDEWHLFKKVKNSKTDMSKDEMDKYLGLKEVNIKDKMVLEIGCGAGPYLDVSGREYGAKHVIGVDLSRAVDAAYENVGNLENITIIQANLFSLPFKEPIFDLIYSLGVLHHTPNTKDAFNAVIPYVKKNGEVSIWLYGKYWERKIRNQNWIRKNITSKFSSKQLYIFSKFASYLYYLYLIPILGDGLRERIPIAMDKDIEVRQLNTFDMYSPTYINYHYLDEVYSWFEEAKFEQIRPNKYLLGMKGIRR